jgi:DivIVA domain-containing protein
MALTPEDVVNKRFNPTKFREGYDQDEVDDFLDEVVVELRRLNQENEELRQRLVASESRINELQRSGGAAPAPASAAAPSAAEPLAETVAAPVVAPEPVVPEPVPAAPVAATPGVDPDHDTGGTNNLLQLARRLHEEHVREGIEKRDALIAEGHATAARLVSEAQESQRAQLGALEERKAGLEAEISQLTSFESEYREKLKGYIEGQLRELESTSAIGDDIAGPGVGSTPAAPPSFGSAPAPSGAAPGSAAAAPGSAAVPGSASAPSAWANAAAPSAPAPSADRPGFASGS